MLHIATMQSNARLRTGQCKAMQDCATVVSRDWRSANGKGFDDDDDNDDDDDDDDDTLEAN